jgi:hypothetical protein
MATNRADHPTSPAQAAAPPGPLQRLTRPKHTSIKINVSPRESKRLTTADTQQ